MASKVNIKNIPSWLSCYYLWLILLCEIQGQDPFCWNSAFCSICFPFLSVSPFFSQSSPTWMYSSRIMNISPFYSLNPFPFNYVVLAFVKRPEVFCCSVFPLIVYNSFSLKLYQTTEKQHRSPWVPYLQHEGK